MEITIDDLYGNTIEVLLEEVGACYPDDDVIYFQGVPCRLSSARPTLTAELEAVKQEKYALERQLQIINEKVAEHLKAGQK